MYWSLQLKIASHDTGGGTPSVVGKIDDSLILLNCASRFRRRLQHHKRGEPHIDLLDGMECHTVCKLAMGGEAPPGRKADFSVTRRDSIQ